MLIRGRFLDGRLICDRETLIVLYYTFLGSKALKDVSEEVRTGLCSLCNGSCEFADTERYSNYKGAFKCMADGNNDRVAFVRQTTAAAIFADYPVTYGNASDYKLLCTDGTTKSESTKTVFHFNRIVLKRTDEHA
jgi:hypothetical protein